MGRAQHGEHVFIQCCSGCAQRSAGVRTGCECSAEADLRAAASALTVQRANRAGIGTRIAHPLLRGTVGFGLSTLTRVADRGRFEHLLWLAGLLDLPAAALTPPKGTKRRMVRFEKFRAEWLWQEDRDPRQRQDSALLYFHGGGFICGGLNTHRRMVAKIAQASGMPAFNVDYRQLPEAHPDETLDDAVESYRYLLEQGFPAERIIVSGDSAGGGLAFRLALATRERGLPMPGGISAIAPWADLDSTARDTHPNRHRDSYIPVQTLALIARRGFAADGELDPAWSPVNGDFTGLPPVLIQVGSTECLLPDSQLLAQRCGEAEVPTLLQIWDRASHVHHAGADLLSDARAAIGELGQFHQQVITGRISTTALPDAI
ncbi:alpha/beta hydrolase [Nocardia miyunensis]|uniref:alpha/beta hydrolase n=1 Tax=Nocardia miyunensis TaxID=282684 RepID=UPI000A82E875|nr:alpha/beta hydrolase [Nocardia miyunensis]